MRADIYYFPFGKEGKTTALTYNTPRELKMYISGLSIGIGGHPVIATDDKNIILEQVNVCWWNKTLRDKMNNTLPQHKKGMKTYNYIVAQRLRVWQYYFNKPQYNKIMELLKQTEKWLDNMEKDKHHGTKLFKREEYLK